MLTQCVNPDCRVALRSFSEGRLFQFEVVSISVAASDDDGLPFDEKPQRQTSHFWLCGTCASRLSLTLEPLHGLKLISLSACYPDAADAITPAQSRTPSEHANHC
jgi:hypothetical protein